MGRKSIPLRDGLKQCRGRYGCGDWKELGLFGKQLDIYPVSHCKQCERRRQEVIRAERRA